MPLDVVDLRTFYASPLGRVAQRAIERTIRSLWPHCNGQSVLGIGYATPYLEGWREGAVRVIALMPAEQGVVAWPEGGTSAVALAEVANLPLPDACIDRVVLAHVLEHVDVPRDLLAEVWRILTPGGRIVIVAPNRRGLWSRVDTTPFGHGRPYSKSQLRELLRETLFSPEYWAELLYVPPFERPTLLRLAGAFERIGGRFALPGAGVHLVEATKQVYRPLLLRKAPRRLPRLAPAAIADAGPAMRAGSDTARRSSTGHEA